MKFDDEIHLEMHFQGAPISDGIAIGVPFFLTMSPEESIPEFPITLGEVDHEITRYRKALFSSREDLLIIQNHLANEGSTDAAKIIDTHIQMLDDPLITTHIEEKIREMQQNTESVFHSVIQDYETRFSQTSDSFFRQRLIDVIDLSKRILRHLCSQKNPDLTDIPPNSVIFAKELAPSDTASAQASRVSAFVTQLGGGNSHAALIARAGGIPFVASVDLQLLQSTNLKCAIVDGQTGKVIINPNPQTLKKYKEIKTRLKIKRELLEKEVHLPAETQDGYSINVFANMGNLSDLDILEKQGAMGVGLLRSEYLFLENREFLSSEEVQYTTYLQAVQKTKGQPVVIRVFDVGGDKNFDCLIEREPNPVLGCRGIRFLLRYKQIFKTQLRAILKVSSQGNVRILLPLISDVEELKEAKRLIEEVKQDLTDQNISYDKQIPIGCMIELPSAALMCDVIAKQSDFLSIGTNDLVQYTLGVDRNNAAMSDFYSPNHPSLIRMIKMIALEAKRHSRSVSVCGEMASNPLSVPLLIGLGIKEFSCAPPYIPGVKKVIRQCSLIECFQLAARVLSLKSSLEISNVLLEHSEALKSQANS